MMILYYQIDCITPKGEEWQTKAANKELCDSQVKFLESHGYTLVTVTPVTDEIYGRG